jgi:hypothetical protein
VCLLAACGNSSNKPHFIDGPPGDAPIDVAIDAAAAAHFGRVEVSQGTDNGSASSGVSVSFSTDKWGPMVGTDGLCNVVNAAGTEPAFSAGTVTITGTSSPIQATPSGTAPNVRYAAVGTVPKPAFNAGATITISGNGGPDVGAFSGSVTAPAAIAGFTTPTSVSRAGYTATWTAGSGPTMWVIVAGFDASGHGAIAICVVSDTGSFTVPASTFAMMPSAANMAFVGLGRVAPMTTTVGGVMITVQATSFVTSGAITLTN